MKHSTVEDEMKGGSKGISVGKAAKKYGVSKATLSRYADQGKVKTLVMPEKRGQSRMLDEQSVYEAVKGKVGVEVGRSLVYRRDEGVSLDAVEVGREYMASCKNRGFASRTYVGTERIIMGYVERYEDLPFKGSEVQEYVNRMNVSQQSKKKYFQDVKTFYSWVEQMYDVPSPIKRGMTPKAKKQLPRAFDSDEVERLIEAIDVNQDKVMVNTFLATGIRAGELVSLDIEDVFAGYIHLKPIEGVKTGEANVRIPDWLYEQLVGLGVVEGALFRDGGGVRLSADSASKRVAKYCKKAGIKGKRLGAHTLRHTAGCNLLEATGDMDFVRQVLRHSSMNMTLVYAQLRPKKMDDKYQEVMKDAVNGQGEFRFAKVGNGS